jgi:hypothetical protein
MEKVMENTEKVIKESLRPVIQCGKIISIAEGQKILERVAPLAPNDSPSFKRRFLEKLFSELRK